MKNLAFGSLGNAKEQSTGGFAPAAGGKKPYNYETNYQFRTT